MSRSERNSQNRVARLYTTPLAEARLGYQHLGNCSKRDGLAPARPGRPGRKPTVHLRPLPDSQAFASCVPSALMPPESSKPVRSRKQDKSDNRSLLLDAAEQLFAQRGFDGCTLREIADHAGVNQGMIHYFFRTKENVFREAYFRRGSTIAAERLRLLNQEESAADGRPLELIRLLEIFLRPAYEVAASGPGGRAFLRMQARLQLDASAFGQEIRKSLYDESSQRFVTAFARSMPGVSYEEVCWRFTFLLGAYQYVLADTGRLEAISEHRLKGKALDEALRYLLPFLEAGMRLPGLPAPQS